MLMLHCRIPLLFSVHGEFGCVWSDLCYHVGETVPAFQGRGGGGQQDLSSDLTAIHIVCVGLSIHWHDNKTNTFWY